MTLGRNSVLIDLDKKERGTRLWQRIVLIGIATALVAAALLAQQRGGSEQAPAPTATPTPTGALLYPRSQLASLALPTGTGIRLESLHNTVPELVVLADSALTKIALRLGRGA